MWSRRDSIVYHMALPMEESYRCLYLFRRCRLPDRTARCKHKRTHDQVSICRSVRLFCLLVLRAPLVRRRSNIHYYVLQGFQQISSYLVSFNSPLIHAQVDGRVLHACEALGVCQGRYVPTTLLAKRLRGFGLAWHSFTLEECEVK